MSDLALPALRRPLRLRGSFLLKIPAAVALTLFADWLSQAGLYWGGPHSMGAVAGLLAALSLALAVGLHPAVWRSRPALVAAGAALTLAGLLAFDPGVLFVLLFLTALTLMPLLARFVRFDDAWRWFPRLTLSLLAGFLAPLLDLVSLLRVRRKRARRSGLDLFGLAGLLVLPLAGTAVFLLLFANANPLIRGFLARLDLRSLFGGLTPGRFAFWMVFGLMAWTVLRPMRLLALPVASAAVSPKALPGVSFASVLLSLVCFNLLFAVQNGLDLAFLWSGAPLPADVTLASYAHRGAYPLIATALLAALFVLMTLRPGSAMAASRPMRLLVFLWIAQNIFLVASSILRTLDYVEVYSLTVLRLAAILWMGLVAAGLALISWRILAGRSTAWLINANVLAALALVVTATLADPAALVAQWNVEHNREVAGSGASLDIGYLRDLGAPALLPLIELQKKPLSVDLKMNLLLATAEITRQMQRDQGDWRSWTPRNAWRLAQATPLSDLTVPLPDTPAPLTDSIER